MNGEEYTPTEDEVREAYAKRRALYRSRDGHVLANDAQYRAEDYAEFRRWLAEHDAETRRQCAEVARRTAQQGMEREQPGSDGWYAVQNLGVAIRAAILAAPAVPRK